MSNKPGELDWSELYKTGKIEQEPIHDKKLAALAKMHVPKDYHKTGSRPSDEELKKDADKIIAGWNDTAEAQWRDDQHENTVIEGRYAEIADKLEKDWKDPSYTFRQLQEARISKDNAEGWTGREPLTKGMTEEEYARWRMKTD